MPTSLFRLPPFLFFIPVVFWEALLTARSGHIRVAKQLGLREDELRRAFGR